MISLIFHLRSQVCISTGIVNSSHKCFSNGPSPKAQPQHRTHLFNTNRHTHTHTHTHTQTRTHTHGRTLKTYSCSGKIRTIPPRSSKAFMLSHTHTHPSQP